MGDHAWGDNRILTFLKEGRQLYKSVYQNKSSIPIPTPRFISCWISEVCNLSCGYCFFSETNSDKTHQYIDADRFIEWLKEARNAGAEALEFSGGGEPTLHPRFEEIFTKASALGYALGIITHACNPMPLEAMVRHFRYVRCGLDSASPETHDAIKRNRRKNYWFYRAIDNIRELVRLRDFNRTDSFTVGIKVVVNSINFHEVPQMMALARNLGVDYIQFKYEHSSDHPVDKDALQDIQDRIDDCAKKNSLSKTKILGTMAHAEATVKCFMSPVHTVVTATGKILQCCFFEKKPIGTIFKPFSETWGSEDHREVIRSTTVEECGKVDCRWNHYNRKMKAIIEDPLRQASFI